MNCLLCESPAKITLDGPLNRKAWVECSVCVTYGFTSQVERELNQHKDKLIPILTERRIRGYSPILITEGETDIKNSVSLATLLLQYPKSPQEMIDRSLLNLSKLFIHPCDSVEIDISKPETFLFFPRTGKKRLDDFVRMASILCDQGYVNKSATSGSITFTMTPEGWGEIDRFETSNIESKQAFVAMWFDDEMISTWENGLSKGIEDAGYSALRIDNKEHNDKICDEIIAEIRRSKFVVADFTKNRGGVYFEAGFALGLGIPVIWTVQQAFLQGEGVHFDTRQYNHIDYKTPDELRNRLNNRIRATII